MLGMAGGPGVVVGTRSDWHLYCRGQVYPLSPLPPVPALPTSTAHLPGPPTPAVWPFPCVPRAGLWVYFAHQHLMCFP